MNSHPLATSVATAVAERAWAQLGTHLTDEVRLRALLPGGAIEEHGRDGVLALFWGTGLTSSAPSYWPTSPATTSATGS